LEGDLKLRLIYEAVASGLLKDMQIDPFNVQDTVCLHLILRRMRDRIYSDYTQRELMTTLVNQICMAVGNKEVYPKVRDEALDLLEYLRDMDFPPTEEEKAKRSQRAGADDIIALWERTFGDPVAMERKVLAGLTSSGFGESAEAKAAREREKWIQASLLRS
jgi:hypothetical protein